MADFSVVIFFSFRGLGYFTGHDYLPSKWSRRLSVCEKQTVTEWTFQDASKMFYLV